MRIRNIIVFFVLLAACFAQNGEPSKLETRLPGLDLNNLSVADAVVQVLHYAKMPGGIVHVMNCGEEMKYSFAVTGMNVTEALDYLASFDKAYGWKLENGAVNFGPASSTPDLLKIQIDRLLVNDKNQSANAVSGKVFSNPKVQARAKELMMTKGAYYGGLTNPDEPTIKIDLHDVTVQSALNSIALKHGSAIWQYSEMHCKTKNEYRVDWVMH